MTFNEYSECANERAICGLLRGIHSEANGDCNIQWGSITLKLLTIPSSKWIIGY